YRCEADRKLCDVAGLVSVRALFQPSRELLFWRRQDRARPGRGLRCPQRHDGARDRTLAGAGAQLHPGTGPVGAGPRGEASDADAHHTDEYRRVNPQMALPALVEDDGTTLFQSLAILEYLEEKYPAPPLLPADAAGRARVRALALMVACEGHPLLTPRVRRYL